MGVMPEADKRVDLDRARTAAQAPFDDSPRGRVLAAMVEVVAHGGYREATVDRVLERAHVGWADFIRLFDDLDACFLATLDAGFGFAAARAEDAASAAGDDAAIETVFEAALRAVLDAAAARPDVTQLCLVEAPALGARALERRQAWLQRFVDLLEVRLERGSSGRGAPPGLAAEMVVGGICEVIQHKVREGEAKQLPTLADELRQLWLPALRAT
jgi:AcrR family transcriptional regulator